MDNRPKRLYERVFDGARVKGDCADGAGSRKPTCVSPVFLKGFRVTGLVVRMFRNSQLAAFPVSGNLFYTNFTFKFNDVGES